MSKKSIKADILIHKTAILGKNVEISEGVEIGPYSIIGDHVKIGSHTIIKTHVVIEKNTQIGSECIFFPGVVAGSDSQDLKAKKQDSFVKIGNKNIFREYVTINRSSYPDGSTIIGDENLFMTYTHIAHDCMIGNKNIFANAVNLGGHVFIENNIVIGGLTGVHQFSRIGSYAMIGGLTRVERDVPPFFTTVGNPAKVRGVNITGLKRNSFSRDAINSLKKAYKLIYNSDMTLEDALNILKKEENSAEVSDLLIFFEKKSKRGIIGFLQVDN